MQIEWSTATFKADNTGDGFQLEVTVHGVGGPAYYGEFQTQLRLQKQISDRNVEIRASGHELWGLVITPADPDDIEGERRWLTAFMEAIEAAAAPKEQQAMTEDARRRQAEAEREAKAEEATRRIRDQ